jgi:hypothetical protein
MSTILFRFVPAALIILLLLSAPAAASAEEPPPPRLIQVDGSDTLVRLLPGDGAYQVSLDGGRQFGRTLERQDTIRLNRVSFDPRSGEPLPEVPAALRAVTGSRTYIVQFVTHPLQAYREAIERLGGTTHQYVPYQALLVRIDPARLDRLLALPFVSWAGPWHPAFKLEGALAELLTADRQDPAPRRYSIMALERGPLMQRSLADRIQRSGGTVDLTIPQGFRLEATLTPGQLLDLARSDEVLFIDRWSPPEPDMNIVREISGANQIESVGGYTGQGVRAEVMDNGLRATHQDFQGTPPILHGQNWSDYYHGTQTYGINFGDGTGNANARGLVPDAQGIFASYNRVTNRYTHTAELVDPDGDYRAVYQSNSWGNSPTTTYTTESAEMDDILFINDILITQSQSNNGSRSSRPQAWAKNIVSVGGVYHHNTLTRTDDQWANGASIGPASDGRIKPDLCHFYDDTLTTGYTSDTSYDSGFGGTSGATPITAGHFGLLFQMWADGIFTGNPGAGADVFEARPHMSTAKALMINTASPYDFSGETADLTRVHQGWGLAHVGNLYDLAEAANWRLPLVIDETEVIAPNETHHYPMTVSGATEWFKITMVYADPMGNPGGGLARINDLSLRVTGPDGEYFGNRGLRTGNWSEDVGDFPNDFDTVENVFIQNPTPGSWLIEVLAEEIIEDGHPETPALDADYALVVTGDVVMGGGAEPTILVGPGPRPGNGTVVRGYSITGEPSSAIDFDAYPALAGYGTRVAAGDLEGSGLPVIVTGPGPGMDHPPLVQAFAADGSTVPGVGFLAYGVSAYGVNVSCGDIDGDGDDEIVTGAGPGPVFGPHVRGWNFDGGAIAAMPRVSFLAYGTPRWGVNAACADIDGDGYDEIITGAGPGAVFGPHVRGWNYDGATLAPMAGVSFFAYGTLKWGVNVTGGDIDGDGIDEIITGAGPGAVFGPHVRGWSVDGGTVSAISEVSFFAYGTDQFGVHVSAADVDRDGIDEIVTAPGPGPGFSAHIRGWNYDGLTLSAIPSLSFLAFGDTAYDGGANTAVAVLQ